MKIITEKSIYVQMNDIGFLCQGDFSMPISILRKLSNNGAIVIDDSNRYDFVEFSDSHEIEFFKKLDWILDYNEINLLSQRDITDLGTKLSHERNSIVRQFNLMTEAEKEKNENMVFQCDLLEYKIYTLRDILWLKQGHITMKLPETCLSEEKEIKGFTKLIKKVFYKKSK